MARILCVLGLFVAFALPVSAQITTGLVTGTATNVRDLPVSGATAVLVNEALGTRSIAVSTSSDGDFVFPNIAAGVYTLEITAEGFKTMRQPGVVVTGGARVGIGRLILSAGVPSDIVTFATLPPAVQSGSGERAFAIAGREVAELPIDRSSFASVTALGPGVEAGEDGEVASRVGGLDQNNVMIDGVSALDTGSNTLMLPLNVESIDMVKVLTSTYQAEYGRSSGLQVSAVTKSGTNRLHGAVYDIETNSRWDTNSWVNQQNGDPKPNTRSTTFGVTVGGPIGRSGSANRLFFFYGHEARPRSIATNGGQPVRLRVPTALERAGDFSRTLSTDSSGRSLGAINPYIKDPLSAAPCTAANTSGCFAAGGVLGRIPANRLYAPGLAVLNRYPLPNVEMALNTTYNYERAAPVVDELTQQPVARVDFLASPSLRISGHYAGQFARDVVTPGAIDGFSDVVNPYPTVHHAGATINYVLNPATFVEGTIGLARNRIASGGAGGLLVGTDANRLSSGLADFPLLYPDAGVVDSRYYAYDVLQDRKPGYWDGQRLLLPPNFAWGSRIGTPPPNQQFPAVLSDNHSEDIALSITRLFGRHTIKAGFYSNHGFKAQNTGGGTANLSFQGFVDFGDNSNNPLDTGFGFSNAAVGVFNEYAQQSKFVEAGLTYDQREFYLQDNWRVSPRLTLDYGVRFTHQGVQHDRYGQASNFFPEQWSAGSAPFLYVAGCSNGADTCIGTNRVAIHPNTGEVLVIPGAATSAAAIGTVVPGTGDPLNGIRAAGNGIVKEGFRWPSMSYGPRFGVAYDATGRQDFIFRGGIGYYFDRPDGNSVLGLSANPPGTTSQQLYYGQLQSLGPGFPTAGVPTLHAYEYDSKIPTTLQWNGGFQIALPGAATVDVAYVGTRGRNRLGGVQGRGAVNLNAIDFGGAYLPLSEDPTLGPSIVPAASAYSTSLLRPFLGYGPIYQQRGDFWERSHSVQASLTRRFHDGLQLGINYTLGLHHEGNIGLERRLQHNAEGNVGIRNDQLVYEDLNRQLDLRAHHLVATAVWEIPPYRSVDGSTGLLTRLTSNWRVAAVLTTGSGPRYDLDYKYDQYGDNINITGSPDYAGRVVYAGDIGSGCTTDQYRQFDAGGVAGPMYGSTGLESGRNLLIGCPDKILNLSLARVVRLGGGRELSIRVDANNALNMVVYTDRVTTIHISDPLQQVLTNSQTLTNGDINPARVTPDTAGFGAATNAKPLRTFRLLARFSF